MSNKNFTNSLSIRNFSEPMNVQQGSTSYAERYMYSMDFAEDASIPFGSDLFKYENNWIKIWRNLARNPYVDFAITDIINEMISVPDNELYPIKMDLSGTSYSDAIKDKIHTEFMGLMRKLQFHKKYFSLLRDWYIDGREYFYVKFNDKGKDIEDIIQLDPLRTKKVVKEDGSIWYLYSDNRKINSVLYQIPSNQMIDINSGLMDDSHQIWISYLSKAYVPLNQLTNIEDALIIYRLSRAPERRVFYVDVGDLSKTKAEQYMKEVINNCRNKMEYDSTTGVVKEKVRQMSLLDDIWLPRRDGSQGTEVSTLAGGQGLSDLGDLDYFKEKLFRSLNVPFSRWQTEGRNATGVLGRTADITRDEVKYTKFISQLRSQYNTLFYILLRSILFIKNIIKPNEFDAEKDNIIFQWNSDNMFETFKRLETMSDRIDILDKCKDYVGTYFSNKWVVKNVLGFTDEEYEEIKEDIEKDNKSNAKNNNNINNDNGFGNDGGYGGNDNDYGNFQQSSPKQEKPEDNSEEETNSDEEENDDFSFGDEEENSEEKSKKSESDEENSEENEKPEEETNSDEEENDDFSFGDEEEEEEKPKQKTKKEGKK